MRKVLLFLFLFFFSFLIFNFSPVLAEEGKFKVTMDAVYKIEADGKTTVTENFSLTNLTNQYFPTEYVTKLGNKEIYNLRAFDNSGNLKIETNKEEIHIKFNNQIVGQDKTLNWTLVYETPEVAHHNGRLWEIFIPPTVDTVSLYFPKEFGKTVYFRPAPDIGDHIWSKNDGISGVFDPANLTLPYQNYDFKLSYRLYNSRLYPVNMDITLPRNTENQKVFLNNLSPKPVNVSVRPDGNWSANYQLGPAASLNVTATGNLAVFLPTKTQTPKIDGYIFQNDGGKFYSWTTTDPDFDHLVFAVNNQTILPTQAEISANKAELDLNQTPKIGLRVDISGGKIYVENYGPTVFPGGNVTLSSGVLTISDPILPTDVLAPFATKTLTFNLTPGGLFSTQNDIITLKFADQTRNYPVSRKPFFANKFILTVSVLFTLGLLSLAAQIARGLSFFGQKREKNLHRKS